MKFRISRRILLPLALIIPVLTLTGCFDDDDTDYTAWRQRNLDFIDSVASLKTDGVELYERIVPEWQPGTFVLMRWHNNRALTAGRLSPWSTSTVDIKYKGYPAYGAPFDSSYRATRWGDSIYRTTPQKNVTGFHAALVNMHEGDSVTVIMPYQAGYGSSAYGNIKPYSTLIFDIKLVKVRALEVPGSN